MVNHPRVDKDKKLMAIPIDVYTKFWGKVK